MRLRSYRIQRRSSVKKTFYQDIYPLKASKYQISKMKKKQASRRQQQQQQQQQEERRRRQQQQQEEQQQQQENHVAERGREEVQARHIIRPRTIELDARIETRSWAFNRDCNQDYIDAAIDAVLRHTNSLDSWEGNVRDRGNRTVFLERQEREEEEEEEEEGQQQNNSIPYPPSAVARVSNGTWKRALKIVLNRLQPVSSNNKNKSHSMNFTLFSPTEQNGMLDYMSLRDMLKVRVTAEMVGDALIGWVKGKGRLASIFRAKFYPDDLNGRQIPRFFSFSILRSKSGENPSLFHIPQQSDSLYLLLTWFYFLFMFRYRAAFKEREKRIKMLHAELFKIANDPGIFGETNHAFLSSLNSHPPHVYSTL